MRSKAARETLAVYGGSSRNTESIISAKIFNANFYEVPELKSV